jgi:hypothetical protein
MKKTKLKNVLSVHSRTDWERWWGLARTSTQGSASSCRNGAQVKLQRFPLSALSAPQATAALHSSFDRAALPSTALSGAWLHLHRPKPAPPGITSPQPPPSFASSSHRRCLPLQLPAASKL